MARSFAWTIALLLIPGPAPAVVINEINYHPPAGDDGLEFVELASDSSTPEDLSGYAFTEGITFEFPPGTILAPRSFLVICADLDALRARYGISNALGNFNDRLDSSGERITLVNQAGIVVQSVHYKDSGKWPVGADGTGHSLVLRNVHLDPSEPESWSQSPRLGGSPGKPNFQDPSEEVVETVVVDAGAEWAYRKGTAPFSSPASAWLSPGFDDGSWPRGPSGFGFRTLGPGKVAYQVPAATAGNQTFSGPLGMDFDVLEDVEVTRLGVFDSGSDGLFLPITARLYDRGSQSVLATLQFTAAAPGELVEGSRFKDLPAPVPLSAGFQGTMVAEGYGAGEPNGNQGVQSLSLSTDDGDGALSFVGGGRYGDPGSPGSFPGNVDGGPADRYAAGTFEFRAAGAAQGTLTAPPGVLTFLADMPGSYTSIGCRRLFSLSAEDLAAPAQYLLGVDFDDGFCAFLNGTEIARASCDPPAGGPLSSGVATGPHAGGEEQLFAVPHDLLLAGENLLALVGYSTGLEDQDMKLLPRLLRRQGPPPEAPDLPVLFNELFRGPSPGSGWAELYNGGTGAVDLSGYTVSEKPARPDPYRLPAGTSLAPGGFLLLTEAATGLVLYSQKVQLFLRNPDGLVAAATTFDRPAPSGVNPGAYSEARFPDGGPLDWVTLTPTPGAPNRVEKVDSVVINEIFYHPPEDRTDEFVELYNRGSKPVDLSGFSFDEGIGYLFPPGTVLAAGGYLVVSKDPAALAAHSQVAALGPYQGVLSDKGESIRLADRLGNPVNRVRYFDGGQWSPWADGGGSSLEVIDPDQDNSSPSAWEASDETGKSSWEELKFHLDSYVPAAESELHLYLVKAGVCLVDDVSIKRNGGANLIPNPGFESSTSPWIIGGTHIASSRITSEAHSGSACLQVVATGKGDTLVNRIETNTSQALTAGPYDVSLWARWQRGTNLLIAHGEYSAGPYRVAPCFTCGVPAPNLSGNPLSAALRMTIPQSLGTPGRENSATARLRARTGGRNLGPVIDRVRHQPPSPEAGKEVRLAARVSDAQGVASVKVFYRIGSAAGSFSSLPLLDDGLNGDGLPGDGLFGGTIPGFPLLTRVVFYLEAADNLGAVRRFPPEAPQKTCVYLVQGPVTDTLERYNIVLDDQRTSELQNRQLHSNDLVSGTFFFENEEVYYDVGVRYRGSPWGRPTRLSYRVRFPEDDLFHRGRRDVNLAKTGTSANEGISHFMISRNAIPGGPAPATEYQWVKASLNGAALGQKGAVEVVDGDFVGKWYGDGSQGPLLKPYGRFVFNDSGNLIGQDGWEGASLVYRGENAENYRGYYVHSMDQTEDRWEPLFTLTRLLDPVQTPDPLLDQTVGTVIDLDRFLRVHAARVLQGDGDAFLVNNGHNGYLVFDSQKKLWGLVAFDTEAAWGNGSPDLFTSADLAVTRLLSRPEPRRAYLRILAEYTAGYWSAATAKPYLDAVQKATGMGTSGILGFIGSSAPRVKSIVQPFLTPKLRIVTNGGSQFTVHEPLVELEGEAPVSMATLLYQEGAGDLAPFPAAWSTPIRWKADFHLLPGKNDLTFLGFDGRGNLLGSVQITVVYQPSGFVRGDANLDLGIDISDPILVLFHLYGGAAIPCADAADFDDSGVIDLSDVIRSLQFLFLSGAPPAAPYPDPGADPSADPLPDCLGG